MGSMVALCEAPEVSSAFHREEGNKGAGGIRGAGALWDGLVPWLERSMGGFGEWGPGGRVGEYFSISCNPFWWRRCITEMSYFEVPFGVESTRRGSKHGVVFGLLRYGTVTLAPVLIPRRWPSTRGGLSSVLSYMLLARGSATQATSTTAR